VHGWHRWMGALLAATVAMLGAQLTASDARAVGQAGSPIQHVVLIMKENRSFDHYFGLFPGVNGASTGELSDGTVIPLPRARDPLADGIGHSTGDFFKAYNGGRNNGFDLEAGAIQNGEYASYGQMHEEDIPNYWSYASHFGLGDNMYSDFHGPSFANNLYAVAAQAGRYDATLDHRSVWTVPMGPNLNNRWGCSNPPGTLVTMIAPNGAKSKVYPCYEFQALPNILAANDVSWAMYSDLEKTSNIHNSLDAITSIRNEPTMWSHVRSLASFVSDAQSGTLPAVSWVIPQWTEHPPLSACRGENDTLTYVNAIMTSQYWNSTAIFIDWDEWGGFYDHVPPRQVNNISYGFRIPLLVISPWTKQGGSPDGGFVSHKFYTHASFIRYVENNWRLPTNLGAADATANGYEDFFDFAQSPKPPLVLSTHPCPPITAAERWQLAHEDD
jgi:phospholipase C